MNTIIADPDEAFPRVVVVNRQLNEMRDLLTEIRDLLTEES